MNTEIEDLCSFSAGTGEAKSFDWERLKMGKSCDVVLVAFSVT